MTPGQRRWLNRLIDEGRSRRPRYGAHPCAVSRRRGWTEGVWVDDMTGTPIERDEVIARKFEGVHVEEMITVAGVAALHNPD